MSDPRITPDPKQARENTPARVAMPVVNLTRQPNGKRDRQVLWGERLMILGRAEGHCYVMCEKDGYHGYVNNTAVTADHTVTHRIHAIATHIYSVSDMKSPEHAALPHGGLINVIALTEKFAQTPQGFIPRQHIYPVHQVEPDFVEVAKLFLGTPYLWGGNSNTGIDCSGLVQAALTACAIPCPGDSDIQEASLGKRLADDTPPQKGDLLFWKGHVALVVNSSTLIHANAYHMACVYEPIADAIARINSQGDGPVTSHRRLEFNLLP